MSQIQEPPLQRPFTIEVGGQTLIDPIWGKWLFDLAQYINSLNSTTGSSTGTGAIARQNSPSFVTPTLGAAQASSINVLGLVTTGSAVFFHQTSAPLNNGAAAAAGTLLNAPAAGNPTKWIAINDNGTARYIPAW